VGRLPDQYDDRYGSAIDEQSENGYPQVWVALLCFDIARQRWQDPKQDGKHRQRQSGRDECGRWRTPALSHRLERSEGAMGRLVAHDGHLEITERFQPVHALPRLHGQEAIEDEAVGGHPGSGQRGDDGRWARHGDDADAICESGIATTTADNGDAAGSDARTRGRTAAAESGSRNARGTTTATHRVCSTDAVTIDAIDNSADVTRRIR